MTQQNNDRSDVQQAQKASADVTAQNQAKQREAEKAPPAKMAKVFRTVQPNQSMQMLMPSGKGICFRNGEFITARPDEQEFLQREIDNGNPFLQARVEEVIPQKSVDELVAERLAEAEKKAYERFIRDTQGAVSPAGISSNDGAGNMATSVNQAALPGAERQRALDNMAELAAHQQGMEAEKKEVEQKVSVIPAEKPTEKQVEAATKPQVRVNLNKPEAEKKEGEDKK